MTDTRTCPKCGALVVPQLTHCRQCKTYLHGTALEGWILQNLLGGFMSGSPGTALLCLLIALYYILMIVLAGPASAVAFSRFSLVQLGATHGPSIWQGDYWRLVTSIFGHHDALHIALNLWCLTAAGPLVEQIFDRKKMIILYVVAGVASMAISHLWYAVLPFGSPFTVSAGASGAVCGMIGAAWIGARRLGPSGKQVADGMKRWAFLMVAWGFFVPGINNAAHLGGFVVGAGLAYVVPIGLTQTVAAQRAMSVAFLAMLAAILVCTGFMLNNLHGFPAGLEDDLYPRGIFGMEIFEGTPPGQSAQTHAWRACGEAYKAGIASPTALNACELNIRINDSIPAGYGMLAELYRAGGDTVRANELQRIFARLQAPRQTR